MLANRKESLTNYPSAVATAIFLLGLLIAFSSIRIGTPSGMLRQSAIIVGISLAITFALEAHLTNLRNLMRVDNMALFALYFLTLFEFLFPQDFFNNLVTSEQTVTGTHLVLLGLGSLAIGRHLTTRKPLGRFISNVQPMSVRELFWLAVACFVAGFLHMWIAVGFNPIAWISQMTGGRFTQSWQRGQLGGIGAILSELLWLTYLIPAIAAILWVKRKEVPKWMLLGLGAMLALVIFSGISSGARYQFSFYVLTFGGGLILTLPKLRLRQVIVIGVPLIVGFLVITFLVVNFRNMGLKKVVDVMVNDRIENYEGVREQFIRGAMADDNFKFIVDRNMYPISVLPSHFPEKYDFLEEEILLHTIVRIVPRALWPGKPESLSVTTEGVLGVKGATIASTIVGESFMAYGVVGIIVGGLLLGILFGLWNRIPVNSSNSTLILLYSAGFVWAALAVRSIVWISVGFLPCAMLLFYAWFLMQIFRRNSTKVKHSISSSEEQIISP